LLFVLGVIIFVMVDGSLDWLFTTTPILAHQMPLASAVHHITVIRKSKGSVPFVCYISCTLKGITTFAPRAGELVQFAPDDDCFKTSSSAFD
jgi:hypothetical protein